MSGLNLQAIRKQARDALNHDYLVTIHPAELFALLDHTRELEAAIQRIQDLHQSVRNNGAWFQICSHDNHTYPCPTIKALEGDQS